MNTLTRRLAAFSFFILVSFGVATLLKSQTTVLTGNQNRVPTVQSLWATTNLNGVWRMGWVRLGSGLQLGTDATGNLELRAVLPPAPPPVIPRMARHEVILTGIPATQTTFTVTLPNTPAPNSQFLVVFNSSLVGYDYVDIITPQGTNTREINITLPVYRPFTAQDRLVIGYWTNDQP